MLGQKRTRLQESGVVQLEVERSLWQELSRWLVDFEALPAFAVSAIAVTLEDETVHLVEPDDGGLEEPALAASPERAVSDLETLLADPAFALAFHCVDVRLRPQLSAHPRLAGVAECDWFGLLHASARPQPALTAQVAITLVLHVLGSLPPRVTPPSASSWPRPPTCAEICRASAARCRRVGRLPPRNCRHSWRPPRLPGSPWARLRGSAPGSWP